MSTIFSVVPVTSVSTDERPVVRDAVALPWLPLDVVVILELGVVTIVAVADVTSPAGTVLPVSNNQEMSAFQPSLSR